MKIFIPFMMALLFDGAFGQAIETNIYNRNDIVFANGMEETNTELIMMYRHPSLPSMVSIEEHPGPFGVPGNRLFGFHGAGKAQKFFEKPGHDKLYARWYQMWETGYNWAWCNHGSALQARSLGSHYRPKGDEHMESRLEPCPYAACRGRLKLYTYYRGMNMDCPFDGQCFGDEFPCMYGTSSGYCSRIPSQAVPPQALPPVMETDKWYCLETMVDMGTPFPDSSTPELFDGVQSFWIDGVQYGPFQKLWHRTVPELKLDNINLFLYHHGNDTNSGCLSGAGKGKGYWIDDVVVAKTRVGCGTRVTTTIDETVTSIKPGQHIAMAKKSNGFQFSKLPTEAFANIRYIAAKPSHVKIVIYDHSGRHTRTLINRDVSEGEGHLIWQQQNLAGGVYFCRALIGKQAFVERFVALR